MITRKMITIAIPTYNGEKTILRAIDSILCQISKDDELIIVASGCTDETICKVKIKAREDKRIKVIIELERKGKSSAMNLIIKHAKSDIIVQTDDDIIVEDNAISKLLKHFKDESIGAVSGNPVPLIPALLF